MRPLAQVAVLCLLTAGLACGGSDSTSPPAPSIGGNWSLQTIDGLHLPTQVTYNGVAVVVASGTFTAIPTTSSSGTWTGTLTSTNGASAGIAGSYTLSGSIVTFQNANGGSGTGNWSGNTLTLPDGPFLLGFAR